MVQSFSFKHAQNVTEPGLRIPNTRYLLLRTVRTVNPDLLRAVLEPLPQLPHLPPM